MTDQTIPELWEWAEYDCPWSYIAAVRLCLGQERYRVRGTPTLMLGDGTKLRHPIAYPQMRGASVVGVSPLPCHGEECIAATRDFFERALHPPVRDPTER